MTVRPSAVAWMEPSEETCATEGLEEEKSRREARGWGVEVEAMTALTCSFSPRPSESVEGESASAGTQVIQVNARLCMGLGRVAESGV